MIELDGIVAGYIDPVVGPLSFSVAAGEIVGLAGANGAGKSTVLRCITGTAKIFSGSIRRSDGLSIAHHRQSPERPPELPLLGRELLRLLGAEQNAPQRAEALMDRPISMLSGGQYQFLQSWACLGGTANLVLLDEPTNNLDGNSIDALGQALDQLAPDRAVILVSHEHEFLRQHCHRLVEVTPWTG